MRFPLFVSCILLYAGANAQNPKLIRQPAKNWHLLDLKSDGMFGISAEKADKELLKNKKAVPVVVAVLDGGVDVNHQDLKQAIWNNPKEIPGNGKDDDKNGFIDDVHGWNFYTTMSKGDEEFDVRELSLQARNNPELKKRLQEKMQQERVKLKSLKEEQAALEQIVQKIGKTAPTRDDFKNYIPVNAAELKMQMAIVQGLNIYPDYIALKRFEMSRDVNALEIELAYFDNQDFDLVTGGPTAHHGTHVAGIIAGKPNAAQGIKGIAGSAKIMVVRTTSGYKPVQKEGMVILRADEAPGAAGMLKVASGIRYAADNGARVINMSFGKDWKTSTPSLDEAVKYAISRDVLIVHSAGNLRLDMDKAESYPNRKIPEGQKVAASWIEVGASGWKDDETLPAAFSNYGKNSVDVYAPGIDLTSTAPRNTYWTDSGTSMAAPVVAGLAALIRAYYPKLTAAQVKDVIMKSVSKRAVLKDKCISEGVVNAYEALKLAAAF